MQPKNGVLCHPSRMTFGSQVPYLAEQRYGFVSFGSIDIVCANAGVVAGGPSWRLSEQARHLFLETLLSARETLYISYAGLSNRDNKESPPCAPVGELLDYLDTRFPPPEGTTKPLVVVMLMSSC